MVDSSNIYNEKEFNALTLFNMDDHAFFSIKMIAS